MKHAQFVDHVTYLSGDQPPTVWSLLVTVFGELTLGERVRISGALLRHMTNLIGIKPEAVRVALHRLRKDGWIESHRKGRNSDYGLTAWGRTQSIEASPRIYSTRQMADRAWLVVHDATETKTPKLDDSVWIAPNLELTSRCVETENSFVTPITATTKLPDWIIQKLCDERTILLSRRLVKALESIEKKGGFPAAMDPCKCVALRVLIVHEWRRIALRLTPFPDYVFGDGWPVSKCRSTVANSLRSLPKPELRVLEQFLVHQGQRDAS